MSCEFMFPTAGDAVEIVGSWEWAGSSIKKGTFGIIGGTYGVRLFDLQITWNFSCFRGYRSYGSKATGVTGTFFEKLLKERGEFYYHTIEFISVSGGPGTVNLPVYLLQPTNKVVKYDAWCWTDSPRRDSALYYKTHGRLWTWDGKNY